MFLIKGDDQSLIAKATTTLVQSLLPEDHLALGVEELAEDSSVSQVLDACLTPAFLSAHRVIVVRGAGRFRGDEVDQFADYLASPMSTTSLIFVAGGGTLSPKLTKLVKSHGNVLDASVPSGKARAAWVTERCAARRIHINAAGMKMLQDRLGDDAAMLDGILDVIEVSYGSDAKIGPDAIAAVVTDRTAAAPWDLTDAIERGDADGAITALRRLLNNGGRHPLVVAASLGKYVTNLSRLDGLSHISEAEAAQRLGLAPFPAKKVTQRSRRLSAAAHRRAQILMAEADVNLRGGSTWPPELTLEVLVARLSRMAVRAGS